MGVFVITLYKFFKKHIVLFVISIVLLFSVSVYLASKLILEEDITKALPGSSDNLGEVLKKSKLTEKLMFSVSLTDTNATPDADKLTLFADELIDSLKNKRFTPFISNITYKINDSIIAGIMDVIYNNLPVFLEKKDYNRIDSLISPAMTDRSLEKCYSALLSPTSFALKNYYIRDPLGISGTGLAKLKQLQFIDNFEIINGAIFSKDKRHLFIYVDPFFPSNQTAKNTVFIERLNKLIDNLSNKYKNTVKAEYYGGAAVAVCNAGQIKKDIVLSVFVAILIILIFIGWFFKSKSIPFISFLPGIFGGILALAIIYIFKSDISAIALAIGSVILGIIVDYALYIFSVYKDKRSPEAVMKDMSLTIVLCSLTSATAFFSLLFVKSEVLRDLGLFAGLSILGAALFSLIILPHLLKLQITNYKLQIDKTKFNFIERIANYSFESNRWLIIFIFLITIIFMFTYNSVDFEEDMTKMNFMSGRVKEAEKNFEKINRATLKSVYIVSTGKNLTQAARSNLKAVEIIEKLKQKNLIKKYSNIGSFLLTDSIQNERIKLWNNYWTADKKKNIIETLKKQGQNYGFNEDAFKEFYRVLNKKYEPVDKEKLRNINHMFLSDRITETDNQTMILSLMKVDNKDREKVYSEFEGNKNIIIIDKQKIITGFINNIKNDFDLLVNLCLIFVTLVLIFSFGRIEIGLLASVPMFVSWFWTLSIMEIFGLKFNIFNIIISTFIFGLGVDYSILIMRGLLMEFKSGQNDLPSYKTSVFLSAFTTIVGTGVLILAKHPALNSIAVISIIGLLSVVLISYTLVPIMFRFLTTTSYKSEAPDQKSSFRNRRVPLTFIDLIFSIIAFTFFIIGCLILNIVFIILFVIPIKNNPKKYILHVCMMYSCRFLVYVMGNIDKKIINEYKESFKTPSVILANHQSHIDLLLILMLNPKIIVITNNWVWNNHLYSFVIKYLDFYTITEGYEIVLPKLKSSLADGYSILIFPEGSRSDDQNINRFYKGAFALSQELKVDILPVIIHGAGDCMNKGENFLKSGKITVKIFQRLKYDDEHFVDDYRKQTKFVLQFFRKEYEILNQEIGNTSYYRSKVIRNYIYKGPILEWYTRVKLSLEKNYELFNNLIPLEAQITDIGCGYGYMDYMLYFVSNKRKITGIDYDADKINIADNCISKNDNLKFVSSDALNYDFTKSDVFILSDILHYLNEENQEKLIKKCKDNLNDKGIIIIRDADKNIKKRHLVSKFTEFFSTNTGFNMMGEKKLYFTSSNKIKEITEKYNMQLQIIDNTLLTSNLTYILKK